MKIVWSPLAIDRASEIGRIVPEIRNKQFRELIYGNYRIIYRIEKKQISILTIRHGKQILQ
jgi:plasmid stabilization system protein ParE